ncbi:hypothetical protein M153_35450001679, partial [Pseudoloma neurophilia]
IELFDPVQVFELNDVKYFLAKLKRVNEPQENRIRGWWCGVLAYSGKIISI